MNRAARRRYQRQVALLFQERMKDVVPDRRKRRLQARNMARYAEVPGHVVEIPAQEAEGQTKAEQDEDGEERTVPLGSLAGYC